MKRSHNYSSSDSDLDDNVEVEKDSCDENGYVNVKMLVLMQYLKYFNFISGVLYLFVSPLLKSTQRKDSFDLINNNLLLFHLLDSLILMAPCHPQQPPKFKPEKGAEG